MNKSITHSIHELLKSSIANDLQKILHNKVPTPYQQTIKLTSAIVGLTLEHMEYGEDYSKKLTLISKKIIQGKKLNVLSKKSPIKKEGADAEVKTEAKVETPAQA